MMPTATRRDWSLSHAPRRVARAVTFVQFWMVAAYVVTGPVPYLWRDAAYPSLVERGVPTWLLFVPALFLIVPGFWVAAFGAATGGVLAVAGGATWVACRSRVSARLGGWLLAGSLLTVALLAFALTAVGNDIRIWVLD